MYDLMRAHECILFSLHEKNAGHGIRMVCSSCRASWRPDSVARFFCSVFPSAEDSVQRIPISFYTAASKANLTLSLPLNWKIVVTVLDDPSIPISLSHLVGDQQWSWYDGLIVNHETYPLPP